MSGVGEYVVFYAPEAVQAAAVTGPTPVCLPPPPPPRPPPRGPPDLAPPVLATPAADQAPVTGGPTVGQRLIELGFVHGVEVEVIETMWPIGDPLAVRVRGSTFALRRREASAILVTLT